MKLIKVPESILGRAKKLADNTGSGLYKLMLNTKGQIESALKLKSPNKSKRSNKKSRSRSRSRSKSK